MDKKQRYQFVYDYAKNFLDKLIAENPKLNGQILQEHLDDRDEYSNLSDANRRLIISLANRKMMSSVINFYKKENTIKPILSDYNPTEIIKNYSNSEELFKIFVNNFEIKNAKSKRNLWKVFSQGIISGSKFLSTFKDKHEFDTFIKTFSLNKYTRSALPMLLSKEIEGFGFSLACDFLKELGYRDYPKPDVHLIEIFYKLKLCNSKEPYEVYKSIVEMSEVVNEDAYTVDKIFWLISSGRFYLVPLEIGRNRNKFIKEVSQKITEL